MNYLDYALESGDNYHDRKVNCRLPHDSILNKPSELASLSSPVKVYNLKDGDPK